MPSGGTTSRRWAWTPESAAPADGSTLWGDGFEVETLMNIRVARAGLAVKEVASYEYPRIHGVSNLNAFRDGWRVLRTILVERSRARKAAAADTITTVSYEAGPESAQDLNLIFPTITG